MPTTYTPDEDVSFPTYPMPLVSTGNNFSEITWNNPLRPIIDGLQNLKVSRDTHVEAAVAARRKGLLNYESAFDNKVLLEAVYGPDFPTTGDFTFTNASDVVVVVGGDLTDEIKSHTFICPADDFLNRVRVKRVIGAGSLQLDYNWKGDTATEIAAVRTGPLVYFFEDLRDLTKRHASTTAAIDTDLQEALGGGTGAYYVATLTATETLSRMKVLWNVEGTATVKANLLGSLVDFTTISYQDRWIDLPAGSSPVIRVDLAADAVLYDIIVLCIP